jgi:hypothetical protein
VISPPNTEAVKDFLRHRIAVERGGRCAPGAGNLDQDGGHTAGQVVRAVQRDHEGERLLDWNAERQRQQHDQRVLRTEPGQDADHDAEQDAEPDDPPQRELRRELPSDELPAQEKIFSMKQQVSRRGHPKGDAEDERRPAHVHEPERHRHRREQRQRQAKDLEQQDERNGDRHHADALKENVARLPERIGAQVAPPLRHLERDARDLDHHQRDERRADDHAVRLRLPGEIGDRPEEVAREPERQERDHEIGAERRLPRHAQPFFLAVSSERYSFASSTIPLA